MKPLLLSLFLVLAFKAHATNDTLTRAQVYNFNVGDTFDYKNENFGYDNEDYLHDSSWNYFSYYRVIIVDKFNSQNQDTLFYARKILGRTTNFIYKDSILSDTVAFDSTSKYTVFDGTDYCGYHLCSITIDTSYNQKIENTALTCPDLGCPNDYDTYVLGLGLATTRRNVGDGNGFGISDITTLIYFSQSGETWGTPATIAVGLPNMTKQPAQISLCPTINTGQFQIKIVGDNSPNCQLTLYDLTGRTIQKAPLKLGINSIEMNNPTRGMYLWNVMCEGGVLQTGKLIVQ